jgi:hypothetical protein
MMDHRLARRVLVAALPLAVMVISPGEHTLPRSSGWGSVISPLSVGTAAAAPSVGGPLRRPDVLNSDVLKSGAPPGDQYHHAARRTLQLVGFSERPVPGRPGHWRRHRA